MDKILKVKRWAGCVALVAATAGLAGCYVAPAPAYYGPRAYVYAAPAPAYGYYHYYGRPYGYGYYHGDRW
jgi:hypothetical protein